MSRYITSCLLTILFVGFQSDLQAQIQLELAGKPVPSYPGFITTTTFNWDDPISVSLDPVWYDDLELAADIFLCEHRSPAEWMADPELLDVRGSSQLHTFLSPTLGANAVELVSTADLPNIYLNSPGVGYDIVFDIDQDGMLSSADFIDGYSEKAGCYIVGDLSQPGPYEVSTLDHSSAFFETFIVYYPSNIEQLEEQPLVVISHGWTHEYWFYDYLGELMASYGYVVMSHRNDVGSGGAANSNLASITALENIDLLLSMEETIGGGILNGKIDNHRIIHAGHSTGGECVVRAYKRLLDGEFVSDYFGHEDIVLVNSIAPVAFLSPAEVHPEGVNYHQFLGGADTDVSGAALNGYVQALSIYERGYGDKTVVYIHGAGHTDFHNSTIGPDWTDGPDLIGKEGTQSVVKPYFLALAEWYANGNLAMEDFLIRSANEFRPSAIEEEVIFSNEYRKALDEVEYVIDDFQTNTSTDLSSSGLEVSSDLDDLHEILMQDYDGSFQWTGGQWSNGMTRARYNDNPKCAVLTWDMTDKFLEYDIATEGADWSMIQDLNFRACQITRHPLNEALDVPISFVVTLSDTDGNSSSISIAPYGVIAEPYQRSASSSDPGTGWQNEFHSIRIRIRDFTVDESGVDISSISSLRFEFGPSFGSETGAIGLDDILLYGESNVPVGIGVLEPNVLQASFVPNPMDDSAVLSLKLSKNSTWSYRVYDAMGRVHRAVNGIRFDRVTVSREAFESGLYFLVINVDGKASTIRFQVM